MEFTNLQHDSYLRAAALCSRSERSSASILKKLKDWGLNEDEAAPVAERLAREKFIDDERFSRSYARDKFRFNKWGKIKIAYCLRMEKIQPPIIELALNEIDAPDYRETLAALLKEKNRGLKSSDPYERKARLFRFAQGRGFETELIHHELNNLKLDG